MARNFTNNEIAAALRETKGMVYLAARKLGCSHETIYKRLRKSPELQALHEALHGETGDVAETRLYDAIERGENWAIAFYLKTKGKHRGYVERQELSLDTHVVEQLTTEQIEQELKRRGVALDTE